MSTLLENFKSFFRAKIFVLKSPLGFNQPCLLRQPGKQRTTMVGELRDVYTKRPHPPPGFTPWLRLVQP